MSDKPEDDTEDTSGFDEAVAALAAKDNPEAEAVETKPEAEAEAETKEPIEADPQDAEAEDTETEEESAPDLWAGVTEEQRLELDRLQQRERSAAGRVSSTQREINRLKQELAAMQAPATEPAAEPVAETPPADTAPPAQQRRADPEREAAEFRLQMFEQRPDWADIASKPEFQEWVSKQAPYIQAKVQVNDVDGALTVLDLWDVSQQQTERARKAQSVQDKRAERLKSATETRGKSSPTPTDSDVDDGLEGWAAGVKRCEQERRERHKYG